MRFASQHFGVLLHKKAAPEGRRDGHGETADKCTTSSLHHHRPGGGSGGGGATSDGTWPSTSKHLYSYQHNFASVDVLQCPPSSPLARPALPSRTVFAAAGGDGAAQLMAALTELAGG